MGRGSGGRKEGKGLYLQRYFGAKTEPRRIEHRGTVPGFPIRSGMTEILGVAEVSGTGFFDATLGCGMDEKMWAVLWPPTIPVAALL